MIKYLFLFIFSFLVVIAEPRAITISVFKKCDFCQGQGIYKCSNCNGTGKIKVYNSFDNEKKYHYEKCQTCDGKGYSEKCYYCNGKGKVKVDSIIFIDDK